MSYDMDRYRPGVEGWIVEDRRQVGARDGSTFTHVAWWYGPQHGWGNTWGPLEPQACPVKVFPLYGDALAAAGSVGLALGHAKGRDTVIRKVEDAEQDYRDRVANRLAEYEERGIPGDEERARGIIDANRETLAWLDETLG